MSNFNRVSNVGTEAHFSKAAVGELDRSRMVASPLHLTTFNAGDLVPIYCAEILPDDVYHSLDVDFVIRQTTLLTPTMGNMEVDLYAFFVPNRIVNQSWKAVMGENYNGSWTANPVTLAPLVASASGVTQIPVGSVADYYGFPTQASISNSVLSLCHDLKFRGYVMIYNERFRDQNYQPPIPMSTLNVYQGFLGNSGINVPLNGFGTVDIGVNASSDGSFASGAIANSLYGSGHTAVAFQVGGASLSQTVNSPGKRFSALSAPLKVNKLHDYFTSVLPSPQKSATVFTPVTGSINSIPVTTVSVDGVNSSIPLRMKSTGSGLSGAALLGLPANQSTSVGVPVTSFGSGTAGEGTFAPTNLATVSGSVTGLNLSVNDLRYAAAIQQVYETLALGGSRYREYIHSFFGIEVDDPFSDVPQYLGHIRRSLDLFQTAQTSASESGNTPQGNLAAFGYTSSSGKFLSVPHRFVEHGYLHVFAVVRHRNIYPSFVARDNFRLSMLDFYQPQLANISEQPVYIREINPFSGGANNAFGYQEAWAEYRYEPDYVTGYMRPGLTDGSLAIWNYADDYNPTQSSADGTWLLSNSQAVLDRTLAVRSSVAPQFKAQFKFFVDKERPMPTYSVPGMDII